MFFPSFLVQNDRLKLRPGTLPWQRLHSIQPLPYPGQWNASVNFLRASCPPRTLIHTTACSLGNLPRHCVLLFYHSSAFFMFQRSILTYSSHMLQMRKCFELQWETDCSHLNYNINDFSQYLFIFCRIMDILSWKILYL